MTLSDSNLVKSLPHVPGIQEERIGEFLWWMCERQRIYQSRFVEGNSPPWTSDEILRDYHFCNVHRELDYGTQVALDRILLEDEPNRDVLLNILVYRFFNRAETLNMLGGFTPAEEFHCEGAVEVLDVYSRNHPLFSSAYRVTTHDWAEARTKHENILLGVVRDDVLVNLDEYTDRIFSAESMEEAFEVLCEIRGVGDFLAYEIVTDLNYRHLPFSENDFVNVGPGAAEGLKTMFGRSGADLLRWFRMAQDELFDHYGLEYPYWDEKPELTLRDFEHSACEVNKYWGIKHRDEPRRRFDPRDHAQDTFEEFR